MNRMTSCCLVVMLLAEMLLAAPRSLAASPDPVWRPGPGAVGDNTYDGYIDQPLPDGQVAPGRPFLISGWFVDKTAQGWAGADDVELFLGLMNDGGTPLGQAFFTQPRPDVAAALGNPYWAASGWSAAVPAAALVGGSNTLSVYAHSPTKGWWYKQISISVGSSTANTRPNAASGHDVSFPNCGQPLPGPSGFAIIGVNGGRAFTPNPCLAAEYAWSLGSTSPTQAHVSFYMNTGNPGPGVSPYWPAAGTTVPQACDGSASAACAYDYGWLAAQDAVNRARTVAGGLATQVPWWLDVEVENSWSTDKASNSADLQGVIAGLRDQHIGWIGIYALSSGWEEIVGTGAENAPFVSIPNWRPGARSPSDVAGWCRRTVTGGDVKFAQFPQGQVDANYACY